MNADQLYQAYKIVSSCRTKSHEIVNELKNNDKFNLFPIPNYFETTICIEETFVKISIKRYGHCDTVLVYYPIQLFIMENVKESVEMFIEMRCKCTNF